MASMSASSPASVTAATPTQHPFQRRVDENKPSKSDVNHIIMDYLITEGYPRAAEKFAKEANIKFPNTDESLQSRVEIRQAIHVGDIDAAINKINDHNPQILDTDPALHFALLRLQLLELIRACSSTPNADIKPALEFAQSQLAPRAATNPQFLKDLELTMSLLLFHPSEASSQPQLAEILRPSLRRDVASRVNEAILETSLAPRQARLHNLVRLRMWSEDMARSTGKDLPPILSFGLEDPNDNLDDANSHRDIADETMAWSR